MRDNLIIALQKARESAGRDNSLSAYLELKDAVTEFIEDTISIPLDKPVKPEIAEVEIHLNYTTDKTIRIYGYTPYGRRQELDILDNLLCLAHNDHIETCNNNLYEIIARLLEAKQPYIITGS